MSANTPFNATYGDRRGFDPAFLVAGQHGEHVFLPALSETLAASAAALLADASRHVLDYHHFSVVMHRHRRFAVYSAANVDFSGRFDLKRPKDIWRFDPRIDAALQVSKDFYRANQFDRGHLSRREDLEYGSTPAEALAAAADTCHWTNCAPQHARFNQNAELWQGLERHILEKAVSLNRFRAQVITGPVFAADDPLLPGFGATPYPLRYWKVVAALGPTGKLFAAAFLLDQREVIDRFGVKGTDLPFAPYKTFQTSIEQIERLTDLSFTGGPPHSPKPLRRCDPLSTKVPRSGPADRSVQVELRHAADIVLPTDL